MLREYVVLNAHARVEKIVENSDLTICWKKKIRGNYMQGMLGRKDDRQIIQF